jgi:hypothetical protein
MRVRVPLLKSHTGRRVVRVLLRERPDALRRAAKDFVRLGGRTSEKCVRVPNEWTLKSRSDLGKG